MNQRLREYELVSMGSSGSCVIANRNDLFAILDLARGCRFPVAVREVGSYTTIPFEDPLQPQLDNRRPWEALNV